MPGEIALLKIVRGNNSKKDPEKVCVFCSKTFISRENRLKHTEKCHKGTALCGSRRNLPIVDETAPKCIV